MDELDQDELNRMWMEEMEESLSGYDIDGDDHLYLCRMEDERKVKFLVLAKTDDEAHSKAVTAFKEVFEDAWEDGWEEDVYVAEELFNFSDGVWYA